MRKDGRIVGHYFQPWEIGGQFSALLQMPSVNVDKLLTLFAPQFLTCKMGIIALSCLAKV